MLIQGIDLNRTVAPARCKGFIVFPNPLNQMMHKILFVYVFMYHSFEEKSELFWTRASIAEAFLRMTLLLLLFLLLGYYELLSYFQRIWLFRKSCPNLSKTEYCCGCCIKIYYEKVNIFFKIYKKYIDLFVLYFFRFSKNRLICPNFVLAFNSFVNIC